MARSSGDACTAGASAWPSRLALAQAAYFLPTGVWPLLSIRTFQRVTGPKTDTWLVKTVGLLIAAIGATLGVAGRRRAVGPEVALLGLSSAASLAAVDVVYVARRRISPIYLLDAVGEVGLIVAWIIALLTDRPRR